MQKTLQSLAAIGAIVGLTACGGPDTSNTDEGVAAAIHSAATGAYITQDDIDRHPNGYPLDVSGVGRVFVKALRPDRGMPHECRVDLASLEDAVRDEGPVIIGDKWLSLHLYSEPEQVGLPWLCLGLGVGCYILINK